jgi:Reverse transcriptase (RNA-dependent DNA polymerase)
MKCFQKHEVFTVTERPENEKVLRTRWVLVKKDNNDKITYRARLVVCGNNQRPDVDVGDTYAPTLTKESLRLVIALASAWGMLIHQMDVEAAF